MSTETTTTTTKGEVEGVEGTDPAELTPEQIAEKAKDKKLADEAASWRKKYRDSEKAVKDTQSQLEAMKVELEDLRSAPDDKQAASEAAQLKREMATLRDELKAQRDENAKNAEKARKQTLQSAITKIVAEAKILDPTGAVELLTGKSKIAADETPVFVTKNEDGDVVEVEMTVDNLKKNGLLNAIFFPATSVPGVGSKGTQDSTRAVVGANGVDLERAKTDSEYYQKNRVAINAERKRLKETDARG
jgi:hypothetical protein